MKQILLLLSLFLFPAIAYSQAGTTIFYDDNFGPGGTISYIADVNGRPSYAGPANGVTVTVSWSSTNSRWEIDLSPPGVGLTFINPTNAANPPDLTFGTWVNVPLDGTVLEAFMGSGTTPDVLPVELTSFTGRALDNANEISWSTASETENERFLIERSTDGQSFIAVGQVDGHGTGTRTHAYRFNDVSPATGVNFYRLRQIDFDGTFALSKVISLENSLEDGKETVYAFPNPAPVGHLRVRYFADLESDVFVSTLSLSGQVLNTATHWVNSGWNSLAVETKNPGIYLLQVTQGEKTVSKRVVLR